MSRIRTAAIAPIVLGVFGVSVLCFLGAWQVERLAWKKGLIAEIEQGMLGDPVALPDKVDPEKHAYLRVAVTGRLERPEIHVLTSIKNVGPGFRVIVPMELSDGAAGPGGRMVLVDLGFVPEKMKNIFDRPHSIRLQKRLFRDEVVGILHWPNETDDWTPPPDEGRRIWFARDVAAMAERLGTEPTLIIAQSHPDGEVPLPRPPGVDLPNNHLEYAITWFGLAIVWATMAIFWLRSRLRGKGA